MQDFKRWAEWQRSHALALRVYRLSERLPPESDSLACDLCKSAFTIPAKIANGCGRGRAAGLVSMLRVALGSARELEYHVLLAKDLGVVSVADYEESLEEISAIKKMLAGHIRRATPRHTNRGYVLRRRTGVWAPRTDN